MNKTGSNTKHTIIIPGMGYRGDRNCQPMTNTFLEGLPLENATIFDYKSEGIIRDATRFFLNKVRVQTDAQKRLVDEIQKHKKVEIIAHSHGALILYDVLNNCKLCRSCRDRISEITTLGAAQMIPPDFIPSGNIINVYHTDDWVFTLFYPNVKKIIEENNNYGKINTIAKYKVILYKHDDINKPYSYCQKSGKMTHLIQCYRFYFLQNVAQTPLPPKSSLPPLKEQLALQMTEVNNGINEIRHYIKRMKVTSCKPLTKQMSEVYNRIKKKTE